MTCEARYPTKSEIVCQLARGHRGSHFYKGPTTLTATKIAVEISWSSEVEILTEEKPVQDSEEMRKT